MRLLTVVTAITLVSSAHAQQQTRVIGDLISGHGVVVDGDTFDIASERIRIWGIDAPEGKASCQREGKGWRPAYEASAVLRECLKGATITCRVQKTQKRVRDLWRQRFVSECWRDDNKRDIAECMVRSGWATDYPGYSGGHYARLEAEPKARRAGLWQCDGDPPTKRWCSRGEDAPCEATYRPLGPPS